MLGLCDLRFYLRDYCCRRFVLSTSLFDVHLRHLAILELEFEESDRLGIGSKGTFRYQKLLIEAEQLDIVGRYRGDKGKDHPTPCLLSRKQLRTRSLRCPTDASPQVDLPARARKSLARSLRVRHARWKRCGPGLASAP